MLRLSCNRRPDGSFRSGIAEKTMFHLRKPNPSTVQKLLEQQRQLDLCYDSVGATETDTPSGCARNHARIRLGDGHAAFDIGKAELKQWQQFQLDWVAVNSTSVPLQAGEVLAVIARSAGLWTVNSCRVVYVIDEVKPRPRFGFALGTLPGHVASGEERFLLEMDADEVVWYDVLSFSRPRHPFTWIGYPYMRRLQKRFAAQSGARMQQLVQEKSSYRESEDVPGVVES